MNCPDCGSTNLKIDFKEGDVDCETCHYHENIGTFGEALGFLRDKYGKSWSFSRQNDRSNLIHVSDHAVGQVFFAEDGSIQLDVFESDVAWRLVIFFEEVFGKDTDIKVNRNCADPDLECPVCISSDGYILRDGEVVCGHCNSFSTGVYEYLISCLRNVGYYVPAEPAWAFTIFTKKWIFEPVPLATFEDRDGQFTLRPVDNRASSFEILRSLIDSLELSKELIVLNKR